MIKIECGQSYQRGVIRFIFVGGVMALAAGGQSAQAQITAAPVPPFIGNNTTVVTTGTATDANSGGPFSNVNVSDSMGPATVTIGQSSGGALTLNNANPGVGDEINLHSAGDTTVTVLATATLNNSTTNASPVTIFIDGPATINNTGTIESTSPTAGSNAIFILGAGTLTNGGTILAGNGGTANDAVEFTNGGTVMNTTTGQITGDTNGVEIEGAPGMVTNAGSISGTTADGVLLGSGGSVMNTTGGTITGATAGVSITGGTLDTNMVSNTGTIVGTTADGVALSTGSVTNSGAGLIQGAMDGIAITADGSVSNSGTIEAGTTGISLAAAGADSSVVLDGGSIGAIPGDAAPMNDVLLQGATATTTLTIDGRTLLTSTGTNLVGGGGTLVLHLVGLTAAQQAAINSANPAAATLTAGGETYTISGFSAIVNQSVSLGSAVDPGLRDLGNKLDAIGLPNGANYDVFYNAALLNPEAAVANLSGRVLTQGVNDLELNSRNGLISDLGNQFDSEIDEGSAGGIDLSHFSIGTSQMLAFIDTSSQLDNLMNIANSRIGGTEMSDSKAMAPTPSPLAAPTWGVWASGTIQIADKDNTTGNPGFQAVNGSPSIGVDYRLSPDLRVGALFSYTTAGADFTDGSRIDSSTELGGLYGLYEHGGWRAHAMAAGGASQYDNTRTTFGGNATSNPDGTDVISDVTGGYQFRLGNGGRLRVTPEAGVQYTHLQQDSFTENGPAAFAISRGTFDADSLRTHVGFRSEYAFQLGPGLQFIPELRAAWYHECLDDSAGVNTSLTGAPALGSFAVRTSDPERDYALVGIGLNTAFSGYHGMPTGLFLNYDVQVGQNDFIQHNVNFGMRVAF